MSEYEFFPTRICNTCPYVPLDDVVLSVCYWDDLQAEWCAMVNFLSVYIDRYLDQIEDLYGTHIQE